MVPIAKHLTDFPVSKHNSTNWEVISHQCFKMIPMYGIFNYISIEYVKYPNDMYTNVYGYSVPEDSPPESPHAFNKLIRTFSGEFIDPKNIFKEFDYLIDKDIPPIEDQIKEFDDKWGTSTVIYPRHLALKTFAKETTSPLLVAEFVPKLKYNNTVLLCFKDRFVKQFIILAEQVNELRKNQVANINTSKQTD